MVSLRQLSKPVLCLSMLCCLSASSACAGRGPQAATPAELPPAAASEWLPADIPIRLRVDLAAIRQSVLGPPLWAGIREALRNRLAESDADSLALLDRVDVAYLAGDVSERNGRGVLVLEGSAELTQDLPTQLGSKPELRHGWPIYRLNDLSVFSPSEGILVITSAAYLSTVCVHPSRRAPPLRASPELPDASLALFVRIDQSTRDGMRSQTGQDGMVAELVAPMVDELESIRFTVGLEDGGLQLQGSFAFSGKRGAQLTGALLGYLSAAMRDNSAAPGSGPSTAAQLLLDELEVRIEGTVVQMDLSLDAVQLGKLMNAASEREQLIPSVPGLTL